MATDYASNSRHRSLSLADRVLRDEEEELLGGAWADLNTTCADSTKPSRF